MSAMSTSWRVRACGASPSLSPRGGVAAFFTREIGACLTGGEAPSFALATVEICVR